MGRLEQEKKDITKMVQLYCKKNHGTKKDLCPACQDLNDFALKRLNVCRHGDEKTFCAHCPTQCYSPRMKAEMKKVMRFSGPRMLIYSPSMVIRHLFHK